MYIELGTAILNQSLLRIKLNCNMDITGYTAIKINFIKPSEVTGSWNATALNTAEGIIFYDLQADDLDEVGYWKIWASVTFGADDIIPAQIYLLNVVAENSAVENVYPSETIPPGSGFIYKEALNHFLSGNINTQDAVFKVMLLNPNYTPNIKHKWDDIILVNYEISGNGYISGGKTLNNISIVNGKLSADNVVWHNVTFTNARYALLYIEDTENTAIALFDLGYTRTVTATDFGLIWGNLGSTRGTILQFSQDTSEQSQYITT